MSTNIFGRDTTEDQKYQDLYASVKRIVDKAERKPLEAGKHISPEQSLTNLQSTIAQMYKPETPEETEVEDVSTT